jgi:hypothetical protein
MPGLGNHVTISVDKRFSNKSSRDSIILLSDIKVTVRTDVKVETMVA